jgi:sigma-B regulation protein RsbU (phosphoserine phosphatase)
MSEQTRMEKWLLHAGRILTTTLDYEELMKLVMELAIKATGAEAALVYRVDRNFKRMRVRFAKCGEDSVKQYKLPMGEGIIGWVAENREPVLANDLESEKRFSQKLEKMIDMNFHSALAVPLIGREQMIGVVEAINKIDGDFNEIDLDTLVGLANQFAVAIDNANLYRDAKRKAIERKLLYDVSKTLSSTLDIDEVLKQIMESLQRVVGFATGGIFLIDEKKDNINAAYSVGYDTEYEELFNLKIGQGIVGWAAKTGEAIIIPDVSKDNRYLKTHPQVKSEIAVPIKIDGRLLGVLNLESEKVSAYDQNSLDLITVFASHAAISIERAYLHDKMLENKRFEEQLHIARQIQLTFLPKKDPVIDGYDISGVNIPSEEVGGDYFDFLKIIDNQTGIAIADVSGKGIPASLIMASFRASLIAEIRNNYAIRVICKKVNSLLCESVKQGNYVTAFYGVLDSKNDIFTFSNCGHNQPILLRNDGRMEYLKEGGMALGIIPGCEYEERPIYLQSGDLIFFYTDGVTEVYNSNGDDFSLDKLIDTLLEYRALSAREIQRNIYKKVREFAADSFVFDDLTMVVLKKR